MPGHRPWREWLEENDEFLPISRDIPILMIQGIVDVDVPVQLTREVNDDLCEAGNVVEYIELPGADHFGARAPVPGLVPGWFADRFAGNAAQSTCGR